MLAQFGAAFAVGVLLGMLVRWGTLALISTLLAGAAVLLLATSWGAARPTWTYLLDMALLQVGYLCGAVLLALGRKRRQRARGGIPQVPIDEP